MARPIRDIGLRTKVRFGPDGEGFGEQITRRLYTMREAVLEQVGEVAQQWAEEAVDYMRANAVWADRTGDARAGLAAYATVQRTRTTVVLHHTVPYGIWLEIRFGGQFAILLPTIEALGPDILRDLDGVLGRSL